MNSSCMMVLAQHVANVLTQEALDALAELLHPIDVVLVPSARCRPRHRACPGLNFLIPFLTSKFQLTSVTRSFITGKAFIGSTVTGSSDRKFREPGHAHQRGMPLTSALHEPHLPALQFQRTARSLADSAWI